MKIVEKLLCISGFGEKKSFFPFSFSYHFSLSFSFSFSIHLFSLLPLAADRHHLTSHVFPLLFSRSEIGYFSTLYSLYENSRSRDHSHNSYWWKFYTTISWARLLNWPISCVYQLRYFEKCLKNIYAFSTRGKMQEFLGVVERERSWEKEWRGLYYWFFFTCFSDWFSLYSISLFSSPFMWDSSSYPFFYFPFPMYK